MVEIGDLVGPARQGEEGLVDQHQATDARFRERGVKSVIGARTDALQRELPVSPGLERVEHRTDIRRPVGERVGEDVFRAGWPETVAQAGEVGTQGGDARPGEPPRELHALPRRAVARIAPAIDDHDDLAGGAGVGIAEDAEQTVVRPEVQWCLDAAARSQDGRLQYLALSFVGGRSSREREGAAHPGDRVVKRRKPHRLERGMTGEGIEIVAPAASRNLGTGLSPGRQAILQALRFGAGKHGDFLAVLRRDFAQVGGRDRRDRGGVETELADLDFARGQDAAAMQLGIERQLSDIGTTAQGRLEEEEAGNVRAPRGGQRGEHGPGPYATQHHLTCAAGGFQPVGRLVDAGLPCRPMVSRALYRVIAGIAGAGVFEAKSPIAGARQSFGQHAKTAIRDQLIAQKTWADQDGNVGRTRIDRRVQPPEAVVNRSRSHRIPYTHTHPRGFPRPRKRL